MNTNDVDDNNEKTYKVESSHMTAAQTASPGFDSGVKCIAKLRLSQFNLYA